MFNPLKTISVSFLLVKSNKKLLFNEDLWEKFTCDMDYDHLHALKTWQELLIIKSIDLALKNQSQYTKFINLIKAIGSQLSKITSDEKHLEFARNEIKLIHKTHSDNNEIRLGMRTCRLFYD